MYFSLKLKGCQVDKIIEELEYVRDLQKVNTGEIQDLINDIKEQCVTERTAMEMYCGRTDLEDCCSCGHSMVTDDDKLRCSIQQKIVDDNDVCEDFN